MSRLKKDFYMNTGIICEFNPFHGGHKHLIESVKGNGGIVCVMSGNFVQRGDFAIFNKYDRAKIALENGADLVIELPTVCAVKSAEGFAESAVKLLEATGVCSHIAFGAECDDIQKLKETSDKLNSKELQREIALGVKSGLSYPASRNRILNSDLLLYPNNILAVEYLRFTKLSPIAIKRIGKGHDSDDQEFSASEIRKQIIDNSDINYCSAQNCERAILSKLRTMRQDDFGKIKDVSGGLENRIYDAVSKAVSLTELYDLIKSKDITHSRVRRIVLRAYLGITEDLPSEAPYIKILGFNSRGREMLGQMKKSASLPIVSRFSDISDEDQKEFFKREALYTDLHGLGFKNTKECGLEYTNQIITIR